MKKEIRIMLDYQCYPIWIYDEVGNFVDNDIIDEIKDDYNLKKKIEEMQDIFDSLYINNDIEFRYNGFELDEEKKDFENLVRQVYHTLYNLLSEKYTIKNMIDVTKM